MTSIKLFEAYCKALVDYGVDSLFGVAGDGNLMLTHTYAATKGARYYAAAHESGAVLMAAGLAQRTDRLGVATVTHGPGLTNTVTALTDASRAHVSIVLIVGDTQVADRDNLQDVDHKQVVAPTGSGFVQVRSPQHALEDLNIAVRRARIERRPIVLNVPSEFWKQDVEYVKYTLSAISQATAPDPSAIEVAVSVMASARRPIILAGIGAIGARKELLALADRIGALTATTLRAADLFADTTWNLGHFGNLATVAAKSVIAEADCIIAFGASLNARTSFRGALLRGKKIVQINYLPNELGRLERIDAGVVGDCGRTALSMIEAFDRLKLPSSTFRTQALATRLAAGVLERTETGTTGYLEAVLRRLDQRFPAERTTAFDAGRYLVTALKLLHVAEPRAYIHANAFGSIGLGMGYAIGAAIGAPNQPVLLTIGDGGFMNGALTEFNTAVRYGLDIVTVVLNDGAYGAEHIQFRAMGLDVGMCLFNWPDFASVAQALGGTGYTVRSIEDLESVLDKLGSRMGPVLIDVKLNPDDIPPDR